MTRRSKYTGELMPTFILKSPNLKALISNNLSASAFFCSLILSNIFMGVKDVLRYFTIQFKQINISRV